MKKYAKISAIIMMFAVILIMTGCGKKTYSSLEDWYNSNPAMAKVLDTMVNKDMEGGKMSIDIKENVIIYRLDMDEAIFGISEDMDNAYKQALDGELEKEHATYVGVIDDVAKASGISASKITLRYEIYNPGASTPGYSAIVSK